MAENVKDARDVCYFKEKECTLPIDTSLAIGAAGRVQAGDEYKAVVITNGGLRLAMNQSDSAFAVGIISSISDDAKYASVVTSGVYPLAVRNAVAPVAINAGSYVVVGDAANQLPYGGYASGQIANAGNATVPTATTRFLAMDNITVAAANAGLLTNRSVDVNYFIRVEIS